MEFIRYLLSEQSQLNGCKTYSYQDSFPIKKSVFDMLAGNIEGMNDKTDKIFSLISSVSKWILTAAFTIFAGICGIYGFAAPAIDKMNTLLLKLYELTNELEQLITNVEVKTGERVISEETAKNIQNKVTLYLNEIM